MGNFREIGSDFWNNKYLCDLKNKLNFNERKKGFLCGRTALDFIIRDAKITIGFNSILLPSYCCHTMIEPFIRNEIDVRFYSVVVGEKGLDCILPKPRVNEALYLMTYFGLGKIDVYNKEEVWQWKFCILDETHSCFALNRILFSDWNIKYSYISYRKWADVKGLAIAEKFCDNFKVEYKEKFHLQYLKVRSEACFRKKMYIETGKGNKKNFLNLYEDSEKILEESYEGYTSLKEGVITYESLDIETIRKRRRENGRYLIDKLKNVSYLRLLYSSMEEGCPLFIPVLVKKNMRDDLRRYLISKNIYFPIHWPISEYHKLNSKEEKELYTQELSIVCDQRYKLSDMERIIDCILDFFKNM